MLPMVITMMVCSPISGTLIGRIGSRRLITLGMAIAGFGTLLFLRGGVHAHYIAIVPAFIVMGFGMSMIFAPMTTAVLNSVESEKSGVASAINGAIREIGTAFGIALLGTIMNRTYQSHYNATSDIVQARSNPALGPVQPLIDLIGSGASLAGRVIEDPHRFPGLPADLVAQIRDASSQAFIVGMDRAIVISSGVIIACSIVSYFLIKEPVAAAAAPEPAFVEDGAHPGTGRRSTKAWPPVPPPPDTGGGFFCGVSGIEREATWAGQKKRPGIVPGLFVSVKGNGISARSASARRLLPWCGRSGHSRRMRPHSGS